MSDCTCREPWCSWCNLQTHPPEWSASIRADHLKRCKPVRLRAAPRPTWRERDRVQFARDYAAVIAQVTIDGRRVWAWSPGEQEKPDFAGTLANVIDFGLRGYGLEHLIEPSRREGPQ